MALSRKATTWIIIFAVPVVLLVGAVAALKLYFTGERLKALLIPRIEEATGREVSIQDISLSILPTIALDVRGLAIANAPGYSDAPLLAVDRLLLDVKLWPLFDKRVEVSSLVLERLRLTLETKEDGSTNYAQKKPTTPASPEPAPAAGSAMAAVLLPDVRIVNGYIDMIDHRDNSRQILEGFHMQASVNVTPATNQARIESKITIDNYSYGSISTPLVTDWRITAEAPVLVDLARNLATIENGKGFLNTIPFEIKGTIDAANKPLLDLAIEAKDVNVAHLLNLTPRAYAERIKGVQGSGKVLAKILVRGVYDSDTRTLPDVSGTINTTNASIHFPNIPKPITNINLVSDFIRSKDKQEFHIRKLSASLGQNPVSLTMDVVDFEDPSLTMNLTASLNLNEVKDYYPLEAGTTLSGRLNAQVSIAGKVNMPDRMKASGSVEFASVTVATAASRNPIKDLNGTIAFNNQIVESKRLAMMIGKSDIALAFTLRNYLSMVADRKARGTRVPPKASATATLSSTHLYTADIMGEESKSGTGDAQKAQKTSGKAAMPLPDVDMTIAANIGTLTMQKFEMKNVRGTMRISNGIISMDNLTMSMFDGIVASRGSINLQNPERPTFALNLDLKSVQANAALSSFTSFGQRLFGDLNMSIDISGALNDTLGLIPQSLNASGRVAVANGRLAGVKVNQQIAGMLNLSDLKEIEFKDWSNTFTIKDGRVAIPELKISALGADYTIGGTHGLDGTMDFKMAMLLSESASAKATVPGFAGEALSALKEPNGRLRLDFLIGGTANDPKVQLDAQAMKARVAEFAQRNLDAEKQKLQQKLDEEAKKKADEAKRKAEELLKGLIRKK